VGIRTPVAILALSEPEVVVTNGFGSDVVGVCTVVAVGTAALVQQILAHSISIGVAVEFASPRLVVVVVVVVAAAAAGRRRITITLSISSFTSTFAIFIVAIVIVFIIAHIMGKLAVVAATTAAIIGKEFADPCACHCLNVITVAIVIVTFVITVIIATATIVTIVTIAFIAIFLRLVGCCMEKGYSNLERKQGGDNKKPKSSNVQSSKVPEVQEKENFAMPSNSDY